MDLHRCRILSGEDGYEVDLERMNSSATVLDWIAQVSGKERGFTVSDVGWLVRALDDLIGLQRRVCGMGHDHHFDVARVLRNP